jgi:hypothetical protein
MIFNYIEECRIYECLDWVDHLDDELVIGIIKVSNKTGYHYFKPEPEVVLECGSMKRISLKLSELNKKP